VFVVGGFMSDQRFDQISRISTVVLKLNICDSKLNLVLSVEDLIIILNKELKIMSKSSKYVMENKTD